MADVDVVSVRVKPNTKTFRSELRAELSKIDHDFNVKVGVNVSQTDLRRVRTEIESVAVKAPTAKIKVQANADQFRAQLEELAANTRVKNLKIDADVAEAQAKIAALKKDRFVLIDADARIEKAEADLAALTAKKRRVNVDAKANFEAINAKLAELTRPRDVEIDVHVDRADQVRSALRKIEGSFNNLVGSARDLTGLTQSVFRNIARLGVGLTAITLGAGAFAQLTLSLVNFTAGLVAASQAAVALPGAFAAFGLTIATIKLGADGIKKAFEGLKPTLTTLKAQVSSVFAQGLTPAVNALKGLIPQLTNGFKGLAASISFAGVSFTDAFKNQGGVRSTNQLLASTANIVRDMAAAFGPFAVALINVAKIGASAIAPLTDGLKGAAQQFLAFTRSAEGTARIQASIKTGIDALKQLGSIAKDVGGILSGVFRAMKADSGDAFGGIKNLTSGMREFVNSAQGQDILTSFFASLRTIVAAVTPLIKTLADVIGRTLTPVIADIATAVGPALNRVFQGIGDALRLATPGIIALATGFADFIDGVRPALPLIGDVASQLGSTLGEALRNLAPPFLQLIQDLAPQLPSVAEAVGKLAVAGIKLLDAFTPLLGPLAQVASVLADQLVPVFEALKPVIGPIADALGKALLGAMQALAPVLPPLVQAFGQIVLALANGLIPILPGLVSLIGPVAQAFILLTPVVLALAIPFIAATGAAIALAQALSGDVKGALQTTKQTIQTTGALTKQIIDTDWAGMAASVSFQAGNISSSVANMGTNVQSEMASGIHGASSILQDGVGGWSGFVAAGTADATAAMGSGVSPWAGLIQGSMANANNEMTGGMSGLVGEARKGIGDATNEVGKLPPNINGQLAGTENQMRSIANSMMQGLANGIAIAGRAAVAAAQAIANQVVAIMSSVLRINSPSKVIRDKIGVAIPEGLAAGIQKGSPLALSAASGLANDVVTASNAAVEGLSPSFQASLAVTSDTTSPIQVAADSAFDRVVAALDSWSIDIDPRGAASLTRTGAVLNGVR